MSATKRKITNTSTKYKCFKGKRFKRHGWAHTKKKQTHVVKQPIYNMSASKHKIANTSAKYKCFKGKRFKGHGWTHTKKKQTHVAKQSIYNMSLSKHKIANTSGKYKCFKGKRFKGHGWAHTKKKQTCVKQNEYIIRIPKVKTRKVVVKTSTIPSAGNGLFLLEPVKRGERITCYSGKRITRSQARDSKSLYIVQISKNIFLDAQGPDHFAGKFINCGRKAKRGINARLSAANTYNVCKRTQIKWISIFATCDINASVSHPVEIYIDYGPDYWI